MSRSPKTVIATVRGIGVAVITSTCGGVKPALLGERCPLLDAEPVLLVDHDETEIGELHDVLEQRVRADRRCPPAPRAASSRAPRVRAADSDPVIRVTRVAVSAPPEHAALGHRPEHRDDRAVMLGGQHLGGGEQGGLPALSR